ncbi:hypothetical protein LTR91_003696 [Friedmanniomyces endolithicus]|uniref:Neutral ceramidase n=1 Tax=Friedmanniomyces endolithicus TaxID=329885 RepID=A0AAN6QZK9_9PEZI|nr:hypothetical protein LTR57_009249 [Friedmanniomyces endolithicus]KAK0999541.1 hypothetical protein LTS01_005309 [Friedmanniomyces endolithicus]KAK1006436.1 hypothetical protein LTR91_003696 [Friedmanniomyces endolithicus]KAK1029939.1 hypothetical protein LTS16_019269 [Friedmanniomyces endolithicus]
MARSSLIVVLAASLLILLSTINILHRTPSRNGQHPLNLPDVRHPISQTPKASDHVPQTTPPPDGGTTYLLGVGKSDITGPVAEINFMGYADPSQLGTGLRQRLYSRAFIVASPDDPEARFAYLVLDTQSGDTAVRHGILTALQDLGGDYARLYGAQNVAVTGTHSHSGPGGWLNYLLPQITSRGFHRQGYEAIVEGAVGSIVRAHEGLKEGRLRVGVVGVDGGSVNRSPWAYLNNPTEEREGYGGDVDRGMTVLRFSHFGEGGERDVGVLSWFAVHGTSMLGNNTLVTGDNKGVAASMFEKSTGSDAFVAGFSQANVGDTSPNVLGAYCEYGDEADELCDFKTSLCGNKTQPCHGRGPYWGRDDAGTASTFEIGRRQFQAARGLFDNTTAGTWTPVTGGMVRSLHHFVDLSTYSFALPNGKLVHTCPAALGYSFAAGTTDGPGAFDFKQAPDDPHASPFWRAIGNRVATPNDTQKACHGEKIILLDVGESSSPYAWSPNIVDVQLLRVGQLFVIVSPGEATTMAGRRWKKAVHDAAEVALTAQDTEEQVAHEQPIVVLGGPANTYTHYIATREEYSIQRYEGASTLYGPWTLDAYIHLTRDFLPDLLSASTPPLPPTLVQGPQPPINVNESLSFITPVIADRAPFFKSFGDVQSDVLAQYKPGETITATFVGASPRNNFRLGETFAAVERFEEGAWRRVRDDGDWSLVFEWKRTSTVTGTSEVSVSWETGWETGGWRRGDRGEGAEHGDLLVRGGEEGEELRGLYRLRYYGDSKALGGSITPFEGVSGEFRIV